MNIGIIGTGKHGSRYANHIIHDIPDMNLSAISRRTAEGQCQADAWHCRYYPKWRTLIEDPAVEAIIAAVPPSLNLDIAKACVLAGKPLLLEKPLAISVESGQEIVARFSHAGLGLTIGHTLRYNPMIMAARENIAKIGQIYSVVAQHHLEPSNLSWLENPRLAGAGVTLHTAIHVFDALKYITGLKVQRVRAEGYQFHNAGVEDLVSVNLEFDNGAVGLIQSSKISPARHGGYQFFGNKGLLTGDQFFNDLELIQGMTRTAIKTQEEMFSIKELLTDWSSFLEGHGKNPIPGEIGLGALQVSMACLQSMKKNDWVEV